MTKKLFSLKDLDGIPVILPTGVSVESSTENVIVSQNKTNNIPERVEDTKNKMYSMKAKMKETVMELLPQLIQTKQAYTIYIKSTIDKRSYKFKFELIRISK